jgi:cell division protease FtsH
MAHDETVDPLTLASETPYYTPADLKYLLNEALRYALFDGRTYMTIRDIRLAQPEHEFGVRSPIKNLAKEDKYRLAAHEAGHAIAIRLFRPHWRIARVTIIRQGAAHGYVLSYPAAEEQDYLSTFDHLTNSLRISAGGKAGEIEFCGEGFQTLGVGGDFANIRNVLFQMAHAGMFGPLGANINVGLNGVSIPRAVRESMEEAFRMSLEEVRMALRLHRDMGEELIKLLLEKEELLADDVEKFFDQYGLFTPKPSIRPQGEVIVVPEGESQT